MCAYITSYISKVDKFNNTSWRDVVRDLDDTLKETAATEARKLSPEQMEVMNIENGDDAIIVGFYKNIVRVMRSLVGQREITAQEAALDASGLPLVSFSCGSIYVQARTPTDSFHTVRRKKDRKRPRPNESSKLSDYVYDIPVTKYIHSK